MLKRLSCTDVSQHVCVYGAGFLTQMLPDMLHMRVRLSRSLSPTSVSVHLLMTLLSMVALPAVAVVGLVPLPLADQPMPLSGRLAVSPLLSFVLLDHVSPPPALHLLLRVLGHRAVLLLVSSERVWFCIP